MILVPHRSCTIVRQWEVEKLENGNYKVKANNNIVGAIDGLLFAIIDFEAQIENADTTEWTLKQDERDTEGDAYVYVRHSCQMSLCRTDSPFFVE